MKVPFLDLKSQIGTIRAEIEERFSSIINNTAFVCGKDVANFENKFTEMQDVKHALGLSSGTDGNHLAMVASDIGQGNEVILPVNTFIATAEGISHAGAKPVFIDINEHTYNIDISRIEEAINQKTKAINPPSIKGLTCWI